MSNNLVDLSGYLEIGEVCMPRDGTSSRYVSGWIHTGADTEGGRHPFLAADRHAEIILEQARVGSGVCSDISLHNCGVLARGKLISFPGRCLLDIKHISFFDTANPYPDATLFTANHVRLQGYLILPDLARPQAALGAWFLTEGASSGGRHSIVLSGALAAKVATASRTQNSQVFQAALSGELVSGPSGGHVQARYISLNKSGYVDETSLKLGK